MKFVKPTLLQHATDYLAQLAYFHGYAQRHTPRALRKLLARSQLHRAWLSGRNGYFIEADVLYGLCHPYGG